MVLCILSSTHTSTHHHFLFPTASQMTTLIEIFPVILLPLHTGCVKPDGAAIPGLSFFSAFIISCWFSVLSVASWKLVDSFRWNCAGFLCLFIVFCACYFLLLPTSLPVFWGAEEDKRYFAYSYHCKERFLLSVPRCCLVITDILKKQRKEITGEGKDFCWEAVLLATAPFGLGRIWQQEEKWFLWVPGRAVSVWGCVWPAFGTCPSTKERLSWLCSGHGVWDNALLVAGAVGSWPEPREPSPGTMEQEFGQGCTDKPALSRGADPVHAALGMFPWEMCWALNACSALEVDLCVGSEGFPGNDLRASLPLTDNDLVLTLDLDTRALLCLDCQTSLSRWSFCPFKVISPWADFSSWIGQSEFPSLFLLLGI